MAAQGPARHRDLQPKRDFAKTKEPKGRKLKGKGDSFVVQKHEASRLHWDFRLELDGVLKSWAVPKGPSLDPGQNRLAMRTEDHPLDYGDFEGTIPAGEYGGGTVMLWDQGRWVPEPGKDPSKTIEEGHLHFTLEGERMKGEWVMFRLKPKPGEKAEPWMLKKVTDEFAAARRRRRLGRQLRDQRDDGPHHGRNRRGRGRLALQPRRAEGRPRKEVRGQGAASVRGAAARDAGRRGADRQRLAARV